MGNRTYLSNLSGRLCFSALHKSKLVLGEIPAYFPSPPLCQGIGGKKEAGKADISPSKPTLSICRRVESMGNRCMEFYPITYGRSRRSCQCTSSVAQLNTISSLQVVLFRHANFPSCTRSVLAIQLTMYLRPPSHATEAGTHKMLNSMWGPQRARLTPAVKCSLSARLRKLRLRDWPRGFDWPNKRIC